jgi:hypothetical protein
MQRNQIATTTTYRVEQTAAVQDLHIASDRLAPSATSRIDDTAASTREEGGAGRIKPAMVHAERRWPLRGK